MYSATDKTALRQEMLLLRRSLSPENAMAFSHAIGKNISTVGAVQRAEIICAYVASKDNEADTRTLIQAWLREQRTILVPVMGPGKALLWSRLLSLQELVPKRFGILEPDEANLRPVTPPPHAVCLVPGIAFDRAGYRIGYGGGYFDRFLSSIPLISIGLAYAFQVLERIPRDPWDRPVDFVVTEEETIARSAGDDLVHRKE